MKAIQKNNQKKIGQFVAEDFRTAAVFTKHKIDFCCRGNRTLQEVCSTNNLDENLLLEELEAITTTIITQTIDYKSWPVDLLIDYIEKKHHRYVEEKTPVILKFLNKLCKVHGEKHPELLEINTLFTGSAGDLASHMKKEELVLFPYVKKMLKTKSQNEDLKLPHFKTVDNPIAMMMQEHDNEGVRFREITKLTDNYNPPANACNTYKVTYAMLDEFEKDLHLHIHLENNILFPQAKTLEQQFG